MAKDEPDSRPIPVSELLARQRESADASAQTGEIPRVAFPRSANPVAQRAARAQADADVGSGSRTASGMPSYPPAHLSGALVDPDVEANQVTGIIPAVAEPPVEVPAADDGGSVTPAAEPVTNSFLSGGDDVDFESYRNFDDVIATDDGPKKRKRGLFGRRRGAAEAETARPAPSPRAVRRATRAAGPVNVDEVAVAEAAAQTTVVESPVDSGDTTRGVPSGPVPAVEDTTTLAPVEPEDLYDDEIPVLDQPFVDPVTGRFAPRATPAPAERATTPDDTPAIVPSATRRAEAGPAAQVQRASSPAAEPAPESGRPKKPRRARITGESSDTAVVDEAPLASRYSPAMQWLIIVGQAIAGLILGAAGFWGFVQLWRWNVYFALVLSAVVIFGIVTLVHLVRRRHDLPTTLLALGVGLFLTLGPLIFLATS